MVNTVCLQTGVAGMMRGNCSPRLFVSSESPFRQTAWSNSLQAKSTRSAQKPCPGIAVGFYSGLIGLLGLIFTGVMYVSEHGFKIRKLL